MTYHILCRFTKSKACFTLFQVKILYVRNLMLSTTEDHLEEVFTNAAEPQPPGKKVVERVKKLKDYAFVHFSEREEALRALKALNGRNVTSLGSIVLGYA